MRVIETDSSYADDHDEFEKCVNDMAYWLEKYCVYPNGQPIMLRDWERAEINAWADSIKEDQQARMQKEGMKWRPQH